MADVEVASVKYTAAKIEHVFRAITCAKDVLSPSIREDAFSREVTWCLDSGHFERRCGKINVGHQCIANGGLPLLTCELFRKVYD